MKTPYVLSWIVVVLAVIASVVGMSVPGMYREPMWSGFGFGNDLVTLVLGAPVLAMSTLRASRGSARGYLVWTGALCYMVYNYVFYVFGAPVTKLFAPHVALFTLSGYALIFALVRGNAGDIGQRFRARTPARWIAGYTFVFATLLGVFWVFPWGKYVIAGAIPQVNGSEHGYRFIAGGDLAFLVSPMILAASWLWRRRSWGFSLAAMFHVQFGMYAVVLITTCLLAVRAGAAAELSMLPVWITVGAGSWLCLAGLLPNAE